MKKIISIVKWEVFQRIKNRLFIVTLLVTPLLVLGIGAAAGFLSEKGIDYTKVVAIKNADKQLFSIISNNLGNDKLDDGQPSFIAVPIGEKSQLDKSLIDIIIELQNDGGGYSVNLSHGNYIVPKDVEKIKRIIITSISEHEVLKSNFSIQLPEVEFHSPSDQSTNKSDFNEFFFTSFAFLFLLIVVVIFSGSNFVRALIEEKSSHIIEILLSSTSSSNIIIGKYFGLIVIGLIQTIFWFSISYLFFSKGSMSISVEQNYPLLILYFVLGYLLYTSIYLAFGAQVSSEAESQQITSLISLFLLLPIILSTQIILAPNSLFTSILTYFPLTSAPVMLIKINLTYIPFSEIFSTVLIQVVSIFIIFKLSSKYFAEGLSQLEKKKRNKS